MFGGISFLFASLLSMEDPDQFSNNADPPASSLTFDDLSERYATDVLRVSYYYLGDRQRAEDVTQDVFVRLITSRPVLADRKRHV